MSKKNRIFKVLDIKSGLFINPNVYPKLSKSGKIFSSLGSLRGHLSHVKHKPGTIRIIELVYTELDVTNEILNEGKGSN